jgi:two-component system sensor histidine kinase KdpD
VRLVAATASADPPGTVIEHLRDALARCRRCPLEEPTGWTIEAAAGTDPPSDPSDADEVVDLEHGVVLAIRGRDIAAEDRHVMHAFASQLEAAVRSRRLTKEVATAAEISKVNELRSRCSRPCRTTCAPRSPRSRHR